MLKISKVSASSYTFPAAPPLESDETLSRKETTLVLAEVTAGEFVGIGYSYADKSAASLIQRVLAQPIEGMDALDIPALHASLLRGARHIGRPGILSRAVSALDIALWDLKAKAFGVSLAKLLGQYRDAIPVYGSGGFTSYSLSQLQEQLYSWVSIGISRVKMKIGNDPRAALERVRAARIAIGLESELFVDANGAFSPREAIALAHRLGEYTVTWFEEPVSSDDVDGLAFVRRHVPLEMNVAAGQFGYELRYFERLIDAQAVDVVQIDATRCLGVTGFLNASGICRARHKPVSAHGAPQIHAHLCCSIPDAIHAEYFHDHVQIESMLFDGAVRPVDGALRPDPDRPGIGIELKKRDSEKFAA